MKNKRLMIIAIVVLIIIAISAYFMMQKKPTEPVILESSYSNEETELQNTTQQVVDVWGNFEDNTTDDYLNKIKPYVTESLFEQQRELADAQKTFNQQAGKPLIQKYIVHKIELVERDSEDSEILVYKVSATREFADQIQESTTYIKYQKVSDEWKIISIESD